MEILTASWVLPVTGPPIRDGRVAVDGGQVAWVGGAGDPGEPEGRRRDLGPGVLLPGLVERPLPPGAVAPRGPVARGRWVRALGRERGGEPRALRARRPCAPRPPPPSASWRSGARSRSGTSRTPWATWTCFRPRASRPWSTSSCSPGIPRRRRRFWPSPSNAWPRSPRRCGPVSRSGSPPTRRTPCHPRCLASWWGAAARPPFTSPSRSTRRPSLPAGAEPGRASWNDAASATSPSRRRA